MKRLPACTAILAVLPFLFSAPASAAETQNWVSTWSAASDTTGKPMQHQTIRQVIRTSAGGSSIRVRISNEYGSKQLDIGAVHIAERASGADTMPGTDHPLTFGGSASVSIAKGESMLSDPVDMDVAALQELAVSIYLPSGSGHATVHGAAMQTTFIATGADGAAASTFPAWTADYSRYFLTDVQVAAGPDAKSVIVIGDSIVDGVGSTFDTNARWPDVLAERLQAWSALQKKAVANAGIAGNRVLKDGAKLFVGPSALSRLQRDALGKPGVQWIVLSEGINDITASDMISAPEQDASADQIIDGMRTVVQRAHEAGIKVCGATLMPYAGVGRPFIYSASGEAKRQAVNAWIRTGGGFDAVADFDAAIRDSADPLRMQAELDSGDHLHPNDAGHAILASTVADSCLKQ